jgi:hypothetical protein
MTEARKSFLLRINAPLWREVEAWAQEEFRSVNGQVEYLLREAVRRRRREPSPSTVADEADEAPPLAEPPRPSDDLEMGRHD